MYPGVKKTAEGQSPRAFRPKPWTCARGTRMKFVSDETHSRGVTAFGSFSVWAFLTTLTDNPSMRRFAEFVKRLRIILCSEHLGDNPRCFMSRRGIDLLLTFLKKAWPRYDRVEPEYATWEELSELFFDNAPMVRAAAESAEREWTPKSVRDLDTWLSDLAALGEYESAFKVPHTAAEELWRRWQYAIIACELEATIEEHINMPAPSDAPDELKGFAIMLYILGGMARQYPKEMFSNR